MSRLKKHVFQNVQDQEHKTLFYNENKLYNIKHRNPVNFAFTVGLTNMPVFFPLSMFQTYCICQFWLRSLRLETLVVTGHVVGAAVIQRVALGTRKGLGKVSIHVHMNASASFKRPS